MSFIIAILMWFFSREPDYPGRYYGGVVSSCNNEVKPWPPEKNKYEALFAEFTKTLKK